MIRKYAQNLLSHVKRSEKSVQELWLPKSPTFLSMWINCYQFAPLEQSHPAKSLSAVWEDLEKSHAAASVLFQNVYSVTVMSIAFFPHSNSNLAHKRVPDPLVNMVHSNVSFHSNRSHSSRISTASHSTFRLAQAYDCESHPLYLTDISSWDGRSVRRNNGMCTKQIFPGLTQN